MSACLSFRSPVVIAWMVLGPASMSLVGAAEKVDYEQQIKPLLAYKCGACHGALKQESSLRLDHGTFLRTGGDSGQVLLPGKGPASLLIERITADEAERMPPEGEGERLTPTEVALLVRWIDAGAKTPDNEPLPADPRQHWAYQSPQRPPAPQIENAAWVRNPLDQFIAAGHAAQQLTPAPPAEPHVLLRRVYLDLIGLPPTSAELEEFLRDPSEEAYDRTVDKLLASPRYGERWGRHWMDIWRYSDWSGELDNQVRGAPKHIWHWRDWIIQSVNDDKPYDRMTLEMLAGDELDPESPEALQATGFLARNFYRFNRNVWLDDAVEHTAKAFLGITMECCRCHDHKFDPITQEEYYRWRAIFDPHQVRTDPIAGSTPSEDGLPRVYDRDHQTPTYLFVRGNEATPDTAHPLSPGTPTVLDGSYDLAEVNLPLAVFYPGLAEILATGTAPLDAADQAIAAAEAQLPAANDRLAKSQAAWNELDAISADVSDPAELTKQKRAAAQQLAEHQSEVEIATRKLALAQAERPAIAARLLAERARYGFDKVAADRTQQLVAAAATADRQAQLCQAELNLATAERALRRAEQTGQNPYKPKRARDAAVEQLAAAKLALADGGDDYRPFGTKYPATSTGRRLAFARWLTSRENPLTARVAVNHIWTRHFGAPLVESVFDFGTRAARPRHSALLDWLAVEFMEHGWSTKHLHRLMVTSATYRLASSSRGSSPENLAKDQDNLWLWRMNSRRLEAEVVRDSMLHVVGNLDTTMGGPEIPLEAGEISLRRAIYFRHAHERQVAMLELFDGASVQECYRRASTVLPQQALALSNSPLVFQQARLLARQLDQQLADKSPGEPDQMQKLNRPFVLTAFNRVLGRPPRPPELERSLAFLLAQKSRLADPTKLTPVGTAKADSLPAAEDPAARARENLIHVLLNHNEFIMLR